MKDVKRILGFISFLVIFLMFVGTVSAASDNISQRNVSTAVDNVSNQMLGVDNDSNLSSSSTTSSSGTKSAVSSVQATSSDSTAPTVKSTSPSSGATGVSAAVTITVTFSESVKLGTGSIVLKNSGGTSIPISKSVSGSVLTVDPTNNLAGGKYTLTLSKGSITDLSGNNLSAYSFSFNVSNTVKNLNTNVTYSSIQAAVNAASSGNTIQVSTGIYTENVYITKKVILKGSTINATIHALDTTLPSIRIISGGSGTTITGFTITGATNDSGLLVYNVTNCNITGNIVTGNGLNNGYNGIWLYYANSTNVTGNTVTNNGLNGIEVTYTKNNKISGNTVNSNLADGIYSYYSNNGTISGNTANSNDYNGIGLYNSNSAIITGNTANSNGYDGISLDNSNSTSITRNNLEFNYFGISLYNTKYNNITNNNATANLVGIYIYNSNTTNITGNNATSSNIGDVSNPYGVGVDILYSDNNTISNNTATDNMVHGIILYYSDNNTLSGNTAANSNNGNGIYVLYSNNNTLSKNTVTNNQYDGIRVGYSNNNKLSGNTITDSQYDGINIEYGNNNTLSGNSVINNGLVGITVSGDNITINAGYDGIFLDNSNNTNITGNNATDNLGCGLAICNSNNNTILNNTLATNGLDGISLYDSNNTNITGNNATGNAQDGIDLSYSDNNTVSGNNATDNTQEGIQLLYSDNNTVSGNNATDNTLDGIVLSYSDNNTVSGNNVTDNTQDGIGLAYAYDNVISKNNIMNNGQDGIYLYYSSADIHFNRITGNGEYGLYNQGTDVIDATDNWWGSNNPTESSTTGSDIYAAIGTVIYDPWLVLTVNASYLSTGNVNITADLTHDSNGNDTSSSGTVPDGIPVDFNTTFGTIGATSYTNRGKSTSELDSDASQDTATITATLDNQDVYLTVNLYPVYDLTTQNGFTSIQAAINDSSTSNGDVIVVVSGTYTENIVLNKQLTLKAVTGGNVIILALDSSSNVITVNSGGSGSTIEGFTIKGSTRSYAIYLNYANNCNITGNTITGNYRGIDLVYSNSTVISGNNITANSNNGICLDSSSNDTISGNNITGNNWNGINTAYSDNNTISENNITNNANFGFFSTYSNSNLLSKNTIANNGNGIYLQNLSNDTISGNDISDNNNQGLYIYDSSATINFNRIVGNGNYGIHNNLGIINATNNWWGSDNPVVSSNSGSDIYNYGGTVTYDPYLVLTISSNEYDDGTSEVTADLTHDNHGNDTSSSGNVPDGIPINFNTTFGTIGTTAYTNKGKATSTLDSNSTHGTATVTATLDNQSVSKTVNLMGIYDTTTNTGYSSIQDAINDSSTSDGDIIEITNGTYTGTGNVNVTINKNISIEGSGTVIINAQGQGNVFTVSNGVTATISGITFENGNVGTSGAGGAIYNHGNLTVTDCIFLNNNANWGGAICNEGNLTVTDCTFLNNTASHDGGAINSASNLTVSGSTFTNNTASHVCGAIINWYGTLNIAGSTFTGNTASSEGGAIGNYGGPATINFNRITGNSPYGLYNAYGGIVNATNNWWGSNNGPLTNSSNICSNSGTVNSSTWLVLNVNVSTINSGGNTTVTADLTHNSNGDDTSSQGHIPDDTPVNFTTNTGTITRTAYTNYGKATTVLNLGSTQTQTVTVAALLDNQNTNATAVVATGSAILNITSTAIDNSTGLPLNISYIVPLNESVTWLSVVWNNTGTFTEELQVIVNGTVVLDKYVYNSAYNTYKDSYSDEVFEAIAYANQNLQYVSLDELTAFWSYVAYTYGLNDTELAFVENYMSNFTDNLTFGLTYPGKYASMTSSVIYADGSSSYVNSDGSVTTESAGYEGIRSFAIATAEVTNDVLQYWVDQYSNYYGEGNMKAAYGTFLTALTTLWYSDSLADEMSSTLNVNWSRCTPTIVMSGITNGGAYVSCLDPAMGMTAVGKVDNVKFFRFINSLMLSEVENAVLSSTGLQVNSTLSNIISGILNGEPFMYVYDEENNRLTLMLENNTESYIIIDLNTGLVLDVEIDNGTIYKGATSSDNAYCFHDGRTDAIYNSASNLLYKSANALADPHTLLSTIGGIALVGACIASGPVGWGLLGLGVLFCAGGSGLFDNIGSANPGYEDPYNWMDFGFSLVLGRVGASGAAEEAGPVIKSVGKNCLAVSNTPIEGTLNPAQIAYKMRFGDYDTVTKNQYVVNGALGKTNTNQFLTFSKEYLKSAGFSVVKNTTEDLT